MKYVFYLFGLLCITLSSVAQNLVTNPGFESVTACPPGPSLFTGYCAGWSSYNNGNPDYFNKCSAGSGADVPSNYAGYQATASGNAYAGIIDYVPIDNKEYITTTLQPMTPGATYEVSMLVSLADNAQFASNGLGVYFFKNAPLYINNSNRLLTPPQVSYAGYGPITNKTQWVRLTQKFVPDSAYDHIVIGGFIDNNNIQLSHQSSGTLQYSYYYIDSVSVRFADTISIKVHDSSLVRCFNDKITASYDVNAAVQFNPGNTFTLQLSNSLGSFSSPLNIGSILATGSGIISGTIPSGLLSGGGYRVRIVASSPSYVSPDNGVNIGIGSAIPVPITYITSPVCEGDTFKLQVTSFTGLTGAVWDGGRFIQSHAANITVFSAKLSDSGIYHVTAYNYGCKASTSGLLVVNTVPAKPIAVQNGPICSGDTLKLKTQATGTINLWKQFNGKSYNGKDVNIPAITLADSGLYIFSTTLNACSAKDTVRVVIKETPYPAPAVNKPCLGDTVFLSANVEADVYTWQGPLGFNSTLRYPFIANTSANAAGTYRITTKGKNGCIASDSVAVVIKPLPEGLIAEASGRSCEGDTILLNARTNNSNLGYNWVGPLGFSAFGAGVVIENISMQTAGSYVVTADRDGCFTKDTVTVTVKHTPIEPDAFANTPLVEGADLLLNIRNEEPGVAYHWIGPQGFDRTGASVSIPKVSLDNSGNYFVNALLGSCSSNKEVLVTIDKLDDPTSLIIYPNSSNGNFIIKGSVAFDQRIEILLYDDKGQLVYNATANTQNKLLHHNVELKNAVANGVYMLRLYVDSKKRVFRVVIKN